MIVVHMLAFFAGVCLLIGRAGFPEDGLLLWGVVITMALVVAVTKDL